MTKQASPYNGVKGLFNIVGKLDRHIQKNENESLSYTTYKTQNGLKT